MALTGVSLVFEVYGVTRSYTGSPFFIGALGRAIRLGANLTSANRTSVGSSEAADAARGTAAAHGYRPVAEPLVPIERLVQPESYYLASPTIAKLADGRLMVVYEQQPTKWGSFEPMKDVKVSADGGSSWDRKGRIGPMQWPTVFQTRSGVYVMGVERTFSKDNNLIISKMLDGDGMQWSKPVRITEGISVVTANGGIDVSAGRVTKAIEVVPSLGRDDRQPETRLTRDLALNLSSRMQPRLRLMQPGGPSLPVVVASVEHTGGFAVGELVKCVGKARGHGAASEAPGLLYFRVMAIDEAQHRLTLQPQAFNVVFADGRRHFPRGSALRIGSGSMIYGGVDWQSLVIQARDGADLTDPSSWVLSNPVGNPASLHIAPLAELLDAYFRADRSVRSSILEDQEELVKRLDGLRDDELQRAGFGSLYWMEGTPVRLRDRRGGDGSLQVLLRVNNDVQCGLGALVSVVDNATDGGASSGGGAAAAVGALPPPPAPARGTFLRYTFAPGMASAHPSVLFDEVTDIYWYVNNINRDSLRNWRAGSGLHVTPHSLCEVDRSTLGLFFSGNAVDWMFAGIVDYSLAFHRHFTYPHMIVDGEDLLITSRATIDDFAPKLYNNHNSNSIVFHRVRNFRRLANLEWVKYMDPEHTLEQHRRPMPSLNHPH